MSARSRAKRISSSRWPATSRLRGRRSGRCEREGERDCIVRRELPTLLERLEEDIAVELRPEHAERFLVCARDPGMGAAHLLAKSLAAPEQASGCFLSS